MFSIKKESFLYYTKYIEFKNNIKILEIVHHNNNYLGYVFEKLLNDEEIIFKLMCNNINLNIISSEELKNNYKIVIKAVKNNYYD